MVMSVGAATFKTFVFRPSGVRGGRLLSLVLCCLLSYYPLSLFFGGTAVCELLWGACGQAPSVRAVCCALAALQKVLVIFRNAISYKKNHSEKIIDVTTLHPPNPTRTRLRDGDSCRVVALAALNGTLQTC